MNNPLRVLLAGGGTAGHIEPALAVGEAFKAKYGAHVTALGTPKGMESTLVPDRGVELHLIDPVPIPRKQPLKLLGVPFKLIKSVNQARKVIKDNHIDVVFGTGGYVSASAYLAAKASGTPFYIHESNAIAGMANKLGVRLGGTGFNAVEGSGMPGEVVGVPVRPGLGSYDENDVDRAREQWGLAEDRRTLVVTGGSQGAASINSAILDAREELIDDGWQILHAYGQKNDPPSPLDHYHGLPYIDDMPLAYAVADLTVCRSGAMTVAEVSSAAVPAIYVPLPHGNGEQGRNSAGVVAAGGALQVADGDLSGARLIQEIRGVDCLETMKINLADSGAGDVAGNLADRIVFELNLDPSTPTS